MVIIFLTKTEGCGKLIIDSKFYMPELAGYSYSITPPVRGQGLC